MLWFDEAKDYGFILTEDGDASMSTETALSKELPQPAAVHGYRSV